MLNKISGIDNYIKLYFKSLYNFNDMKNIIIVILMATTLNLSAVTNSTLNKYGLTKGTPNIESFNEMTFGPDGILFIGDSKGGKIFAIDTQDTIESEIKTAFLIKDLESKIADKLGLSKQDIMFHEMVLNPISKNVYISISLERDLWKKPWRNPDLLAYSSILLKIDINTKEISKVNLNNIFFSQYKVNDAPPKGLIHRSRNQRIQTFTDMKFSDNELFLAGTADLLNVFRSIDFPFSQTAITTKIEHFDYGHFRFNTGPPAEVFETYIENGRKKLLTVFHGSLRSFDLDEFGKSDTAKIRGKNVGELWTRGLDMIQYNYNNIDYVLISLANYGIAKLKLDDIKTFNGDYVAEKMKLTRRERVSVAEREMFTNTLVGVNYRVYPKPVQQMENYSNDHLMTLQRLDNGKMMLGLRSKLNLNRLIFPQGIKEYIEQYINRTSIESGINELKSVLKNRRDEYNINERELNGLGYSILSKSKKDAMEVFKIYVQTYPESANAYDSLGENYMNSGDTKNAIINYEKSLELNPNNNNAKEMLKRLKN